MSESSEVPTIKTAQLDVETLGRLAASDEQFATLLVLEGAAVKQTYILDNPTTVIGRSPLATVPLISDAVASREHAKVMLDLESGEADRKRYFLMDLGSTNGTFLNGRRLASQERCLLSDGDRFTIGSHTFVFVLPLRSGSKFLTGDLSRISVFDVIQVVEANRLTATFTVRATHGQGGWVGFNEGLIVTCEVGHLRGLDAFRKFVGFTEGFFEVERSTKPFPVTITAGSNTSLTLDILRELDEANAGLSGDAEPA
ncbi:FHA domain-containing protein [Chloracidobacterium sp. MS 40/45]|uniref:FHA domain-containing protein n=1 Tax=Chloracidobacterium aggregatum TaxID=2851959 RepID=UPI001B8D309F|nr:FHA domain-containing protein [Chloracidobacterium aggregatum]QUW01682.1 FHA domain-containing protein [Chloracidobacterium sp. MS 40/45]